jgi:hypothetical protein
VRNADGELRKFQPEDALAAFEIACSAIRAALGETSGKRSVVITHHAPSLKGLNPFHAGNGLDGALPAISSR